MIDNLKQLRERTCASMVECRKALEESDGDLEEAVKVIRRKGADLASKRVGRETKQGLIEAYIHANGKIGVLLELNCETDFVARNEIFKELAHNLAMHIAAMNPQYISSTDIPQEIIEEDICLLSQSFVKNQDLTIQEVINEVIAKIGENIKIGKFARFEI